MQVKIGSFTGNGTDDHAISGIGFQPDLVIIKNIGTATNADLVFSTEKMTSGQSLIFRADSTYLTDGIKSLDSDGFTLGTSSRVNTSSVNYMYLAVKDNGAGDFATFTYTGDNTDARAITGLGFSPATIFIKGEQNLTGCHSYSTRTSGNKGFQFWGGGPRGDLIDSFDSDGFTISNGSDDGAAEVNASGVTFHGFAFKAVSGKCGSFHYTGDGTDDRNITGFGFDPAFVILSSDASAGGSGEPILASKENTAGYSNPVTAEEQENKIQGLITDGIQVGSDAGVNYSSNEMYGFALADDFTTGNSSEPYSRNFDSESTGAASNFSNGVKDASLLLTVDATVYYGASGKSLKIDNDSANVGHNWQYDSANELSSGDGTFTAKIRLGTVNDGSGCRTGIIFRGADDGSTCYAAMLRPQSSTATVRLSRFSGGTETTIDTQTFDGAATFEADAWYNIKIYVSGSTIKVRVWKDGDSEPGTWLIDTTDSTYDNTNVKIGYYFFTSTASSRISYIDSITEESSGGGESSTPTAHPTNPRHPVHGKA